VALPSRFQNLAVHFTMSRILAVDEAIVVQLFQNGVAVPGFLASWGAGEDTGIDKLIVTPVQVFPAGDSFDLRISLTNLNPPDAFLSFVSATIGVV
jgi:hypothetical protein